MNKTSSTQAEPTAQAVQPVTTAGPAADFRRYVRIGVPQVGDAFNVSVSLIAKHPDMPTVCVGTGAAHFQVYPTPDQARAIAAMLLELADRFEAANPAVIQ